MENRFCHFSIISKVMRAFALLVLFAGSVCAQTPQIASGDDFTAIIDSSNDLYTYGANGSGQLGIGDTTDVGGAMQRVEPQGVWLSVAVSKRKDKAEGTASGLGHVLAIREGGTLWAWGANDRGQLGIGTYVDQSSPVQVIGIASVVEVAAGSHFSMARTSNGQVFVWGDNTSGQLARVINPLIDSLGFGLPEDDNGDPLNCISSPVPLDELNSYTSIAAGLTSAAAVRANGGLYTWGYSKTLQLGYPSSASIQERVQPTLTPYRVGFSNEWTKVFAGNTTCFALQGGKLYAWGGSGNTGTGAWSYEPVRVGNDSDWETVSVGYDHTLALKNGGELWGWGNNAEGELGLPLDLSSPSANQYFYTPERLEQGSTFSAIGAGYQFSTIITDDLPPVVQTAGINTVGQLGIGYTDNGNHVSFDEESLDFSIFDTVDLSLDSLSLDEDPSYPGVDPATNLIAGGTLYISVEMANIGWADLTTDFDLGAKLSVDAVYDAADLDLDVIDGSLVSTNIDAGDSVTVGFRLELPATLDSGQYYLILRGDSGVALNEDPANRENNDISSDLLTFIPDVTADVEILSSDFASGTTLNAVLQVENIGTWSTTESFEITAVLSPVISYESPAAIPLTVTAGARLSDQINPSESLNAFVSVLLPAAEDIPDGCYYLIYRLDDAEVLGEVVVLNNDALVADQICFGPGFADLVVTNLQALSDPLNPSSDPANNLIAGGQLLVSMDLGNIGNTDIADGFELAAVLSTSSYFDDPSAIPLTFIDGQSVEAVIPVDGSVAVGARFQLPDFVDIDSGVYNLIIRGDSVEVLTEITRANNDGSLDGLSFIPDLQLNVEILSDSIEVLPTVIDAIATIKNVGSWTVGGGYGLSGVIVTTPFYDGLTPADIFITSDTIITDDLDPGDSIEVLVTFFIPPVADDCYYLAFRVDGARLLEEEVITNNDFVTSEICFGLEVGDLSVASVTAVQSPLFPGVAPLSNLIAGGDLYLSIALENIGDLDITSDFELQAFLSPSAFYTDPEAIELTFLDGQLVTTDILAGAQIDVGARLELPAILESGTYNLIILGDSGEVLTESTRVNNDGSLDAIGVAADLSLEVAIFDDTFAAGATITAIATVTNEGTWTMSTDFSLSSVFSTTADFDGLTPTVLSVTGGLVTEDLNPGESIDVLISFDLPAAIVDGCYYLAFRADEAGAVDELQLLNNDFVTSEICFGLEVGDLSVASVTAVQSPLFPGVAPLSNLIAGGDLYLSIALENIGDLDITSDFELQAFLSPSAFYTDPEAIELTFLDGQLVTTDILAGAQIDVGARLELPAILESGTYNLIILGDSGEVLTESTRVNNDGSLDAIGVAADLSLEVAIFDDTFAAGATITAIATVTNEGTWTMSTDFSLSSVFSTTADFDGLTPTVLSVTGGLVTEDLNPGESIDVLISFDLPAAIVDGCYYLAFRADEAGAVDELQLLNNDFVTSEICFGLEVGDLSVASVTAVQSPLFPGVAPLSNLIAGGDLYLSIALENIGDLDITSDFELQAFLSPSAFYTDPEAIELTFLDGQLVTTDILAGAQIDVGARLELPAILESGTYNLIILGDSGEVLTESTRVNNDGSLDAIGVAADLSLEVAIFDDTFAAGATITAIATVTNEGTWTMSTDFSLSSVFSTTADFDGLTPTVLSVTGGLVTEDLNPGESIDVLISFDLPAAIVDGCYYLAFRADEAGAVDELQLLNNDFVTSEICFGLEVGDLSVASVTAVQSPLFPGVAPLSNLIAGGDLYLSIALENIGDLDITSDFELQAFLSPSAFYTDPEAIELTFLDGQLVTTDILAGAQIDVGARLELPAILESGTYNLIILGDSGEVLTESTRVNNDGSLDAIGVAADLSLEVAIFDDTFAAGATITAIATVTNEGTWTMSTDFSLSSVFSTTADFDGLTPTVLSVTGGLVTEDLNPGESIDVLISFDLPAAIVDGCYYLAFRADEAGAVDELQLLNNDFVTSEICFGLEVGDLSVASVTAVQSPLFPGVAPLSNLIAGGDLYLSIALENIGDLDITSDFELQAFLSPSAFYTDPEAIELTFLDGQLVTTDILAGAQIDVGARLELPAILESGTYNLIILGDSGEVLTESTRVNNDGSLDAIGVAADLSLEVAIFDDTFAAGATITAIATVTNEGTWTMSTDFSLSSVFSTTADFDGLTPTVLSVTGGLVTEDLNPGESIDVLISFDLPAAIVDGCYYLAFRADEAGAVDELQLLNNDFVTSEICFGSTDADLSRLWCDCIGISGSSWCGSA